MNPQHHALGAPLELDTSRTPFLEATLHLLLTEGQPPSLERGKTPLDPRGQSPTGPAGVPARPRFPYSGPHLRRHSWASKAAVTSACGPLCWPLLGTQPSVISAFHWRPQVGGETHQLPGRPRSGEHEGLSTTVH